MTESRGLASFFPVPRRSDDLVGSSVIVTSEAALRPVRRLLQTSGKQLAEKVPGSQVRMRALGRDLAMAAEDLVSRVCAL